MIHTLFAHAGETHETAAEAAQHASTGIVIGTTQLFWLTLILVPSILLLILHVMKCKITTKLLLLSVFLILFSIVSYQHPGAYSVIALAVGFGIVFLLSIAGISSSEES
jgi:hypothetical protein